MTLVAFPPGGGSLLMPATSRRSFRAGLALWSTCRPLARLSRAAAYHLVGVAGPALLRVFPTERWEPPVPDTTWSSMVELWSSWYGDFDEMAVYRPRQEQRRGFALLLLRDGTPAGFVKCRPEWDFAAEAGIVASLAQARTFSTPALVGVGDVDGWGVLGLTGLGGLHSPRPPASTEAVAAEISRLLQGGEPPRSDGWMPMHGDLGPWNLRRHPGLGPVIFDWEESRHAPPGADVVFHSAACRATLVRGPGPLPADAGEAVEFWREEIPRRFGGTRADRRLADRMMDALSS